MIVTAPLRIASLLIMDGFAIESSRIEMAFSLGNLSVKELIYRDKTLFFSIFAAFQKLIDEAIVDTISTNSGSK